MLAVEIILHKIKFKFKNFAFVSQKAFQMTGKLFFNEMKPNPRTALPAKMKLSLGSATLLSFGTEHLPSTAYHWAPQEPWLPHNHNIAPERFLLWPLPRTGFPASSSSLPDWRLFILLQPNSISSGSSPLKLNQTELILSPLVCYCITVNCFLVCLPWGKVMGHPSW